MTSASLCGDVCGEWLGQTALRFLAESEAAGRIRPYAGTVGAILGAACLCGSLLAAGLLAVNRCSNLLVTAVPLVCLLLVSKVALAIVRARLQSSRFTLAAVGGALASFAASVVLLAVFHTPAAVILGQCIGFACQIAFVLPHLRLPLTVLPDPSLAGSMLAYGLPIAVTTIGSQVLQYLDRFLLGAIRGPFEVGLYAANYSLADRAIALLFSSLFLAAHPLMVLAWSEGRRDEVYKLIDRIRRLTIIGGVPFVIGTAIAGRTIVRIALASEYASASVAVPIVAAGSLCWFLGILNHQPIELEKRTALITSMVGLLAALNLFLNLVLIPRYGWLGAALATLAGYAGYFVLSRAVATRITGMRWRFPRRTVLTSVCASGVAFGSAMLVFHRLNSGPAALICLLATAALAYVTAMWASGELKYVMA